jgi:hypothetical protein
MNHPYEQIRQTLFDACYYSRIGMTQRLPADDVVVLDRGIVTLTTTGKKKKKPHRIHLITMFVIEHERCDIITLSVKAAMLAIIMKYDYG